MRSPQNIGLSRIAQVFLAATALAPVLLVWAAGAYGTSRLYALSAAAVTVLLVAVCVGLLTLATRELQFDPLVFTKVVRVDKDALGFLVAYALPLVVSHDATQLLPLGVLMVIVGVVLVQLQILHVNPLLGMLGYHFYEVQLNSSDTALVITRSRDLPPLTTRGQQLAPGLWLLTDLARNPQ